MGKSCRNQPRAAARRIADSCSGSSPSTVLLLGWLLYMYHTATRMASFMGQGKSTVYCWSLFSPPTQQLDWPIAHRFLIVRYLKSSKDDLCTKRRPTIGPRHLLLYLPQDLKLTASGISTWPILSPDSNAVTKPREGFGKSRAEDKSSFSPVSSTPRQMLFVPFLSPPSEAPKKSTKEKSRLNGKGTLSSFHVWFPFSVSKNLARSMVPKNPSAHVPCPFTLMTGCLNIYAFFCSQKIYICLFLFYYVL